MPARASRVGTEGSDVDVDDRDDRQEVERTGAGGAAHAAPGAPGGQRRVRILGAEVAGEATAVVPAVRRDDEQDLPGSVVPVDTDEPDVAVRHPHDEAAGNVEEPLRPGETAMPHWTEPPTGAVPAVLAREERDVPEFAAPTWREERSDWRAHDEEFDTSLFSDEEAPVGSLDESEAPDLERRPWEFDLDETSAPSGAPTGGRGAVDASPVPGEGPAWAEAPADERATAPTWFDPDEPPELAGDTPPYGGDDVKVPHEAQEPPVQVGRRGSTRRIRARRPKGAVAGAAAPLAASPPGAAVTEVPGVGIGRGGVADLASADEGPARAGRRRGGPARSRRPAGPADRSPGGGPPAGTASRPRDARPAGREPGIAVRIVTGVGVAVVALVLFGLGTVTSLLLALFVVTFAAGELFGVLRRVGYHPATLLGLVGTVSLMVAGYERGIGALPLVMVLISVFSMLWYLFGIERGRPVAGVAATLLATGWVGLLGAFAGVLLSPSTFPDRHGIAFLLGAIVATVGNDVGGLVGGGFFGRHPLAPSVSPNKTWEGLVGGMVLSVVLSAVVTGSIHPWTPSKAALLGVVVAVVAPLGDLSESLLKRDLGLKDMGTLLPGHGGVLDRIDAMLFVLPATYYVVRALNLG